MIRSVPALPNERLPGPDLPVRGRRHPWRWIAGGVVLVLLALLLRAFAQGNIRWAIVGEFLTAPVILKGFVWTLSLIHI